MIEITSAADVDHIVAPWHFRYLMNFRWLTMGGTRHTFSFVLIFVIALLAGCRYPAQRTVSGNVKGDLSDDSLITLSAPEVILPTFDSSLALYKGLYKQASVVAFYQYRDNRPAWINAQLQAGTPLADSMASFIANIRYYGLLPDNYHANELFLTMDTPASAEYLLRRDILLTDAFLSLAHDLQFGRIKKSDAEGDSLHVILLLDLIDDGGLQKNLQSLEPRADGYHALKQKLNFLLDSIDAPQRATLLQGITIDSIAVHKKVRAIEINMERWKWENRDFGDRYIIVNIPSFFARVVENDTVVLESKVIVGTVQNPTPQLTGVIERFITYPYWHVPRKIAVNELLPLIRQDVAYLQRHNFDVLDLKGRLLDADSVTWQSFTSNYFPVLLRQREGPENSLGILKFVFDNRFAVFLHDTNAPGLFRNSSRAFSHGCIRMEQARRFAHYLLTGDPDLKSPTLEKYLRQATRHYIDIPAPMPIYVRYFTAEVRNETLYVYKDLYKKDRPVIDQIYPRQARYDY